MIKAYYLAVAQDISTLQKKVNTAIERGYQPIYPIQQLTFKQKDGQVQGYLQQMIKEEETCTDSENTA